MVTTKQAISYKRKIILCPQWLLLAAIALVLGTYHHSADAHLMTSFNNPDSSLSTASDFSPPSAFLPGLTVPLATIRDEVPFSVTYDFDSSNLSDTFEFAITNLSRQGLADIEINTLQLLFVKDSLTASSQQASGSSTSFVGTGSPAVLSETSSIGAGWYEKIFTFSGWETGTLLNIGFDWENFHPSGDTDDSFKIYYGINDSLVSKPVSNVPVPAAAWLFGTGLFGLFGFQRRHLLAES